MYKGKYRRKKELAKIFIILLVTFSVFGVERYFSQTHFLGNTKIEGVNCSYLGIEKAIEKINLQKENEIVTYRFSNGKTYSVPLKKLGVHVDETRIAQIFEQQHINTKEIRNYQLDGFILIDVNMLKEYLKQIPELQEANFVEPQNAYIDVNEAGFFIQKEVIGNVVDFEEAIDFALEKLQNDEKYIDFLPITDTTPEIVVEDLVSERDELNKTFNSSINFNLADGSILTLDSNTIKNWVYKDENGKFMFDFENGISAFVEELALRVDEANSNTRFAATDCSGLVTVNLPQEFRVQLDKEKQIAEIRSMLGNPEPIYKIPIYDKAIIFDNLINYVEIDISRQHVWLYKDGVLIMDSPCVTGNVSRGWDTPTGVFHLLNKDPNAGLKGADYDVTVKYWMRFFPGYGMHDSKRSQFGGDIYLTNGSHGCVNVPEWAAEVAYNTIDKETFLFVIYKS